MWQSNQFFVILLTFELFLYPLSTLPQPQEEASRGRAVLTGGRRLNGAVPLSSLRPGGRRCTSLSSAAGATAEGRTRRAPAEGQNWGAWRVGAVAPNGDRRRRRTSPFSPGVLTAAAAGGKERVDRSAAARQTPVILRRR